MKYKISCTVEKTEIQVNDYPKGNKRLLGFIDTKDISGYNELIPGTKALLLSGISKEIEFLLNTREPKKSVSEAIYSVMALLHRKQT